MDGEKTEAAGIWHLAANSNSWLTSDIWQPGWTRSWHLLSHSQPQTHSIPRPHRPIPRPHRPIPKLLLKILPSHALPHIILNFKKARSPGKQCLDLVGIDRYKFQALPPKMGHDQHKISHMYMTVTFEPTKLFLVRELVVKKRTTIDQNGSKW